MDDRRTLDETIRADYRLVNRAMDRVVLPLLIERGTTMAQLKALIAVTAAGEEGIAITALGSELSIGQPSASLIVDQLAKRGYAERHPDPDDKRRVLVKATPTGEELVVELRLGRRSTFASWMAHVTDEDALALAQGMRALAAAAEAIGDASLVPAADEGQGE